MARPTIEPVTAALLPRFAKFLHEHLDRNRSVHDWIAALDASWSKRRGDHGQMLIAEGEVVGGIGALYADRTVGGREVGFCNITSWCVLESYRKDSMRLAMALTADKSINYTDFSPTAVVSGSLQFLKFRPLDASQLIVPNRPSFGNARLIVEPAEIAQALQGEALTGYRDHLRFPWLHHAAIDTRDGTCHVVYKPFRYRSTAAARILHVGDRRVFRAGFGVLSSHLLTRGVLTSHLDLRLLPERIPGSFVRTGYIPKRFLGDGIADEAVDYLYSETVSMDL